MRFLEDSYVRYDYYVNNNYHCISFNVIKFKFKFSLFTKTK